MIKSSRAAEPSPPLPAPMPPRPVAPPLHRWTGAVLVVDDDESMCEALESALTRRGFTVTWTTVPLEALRLLEVTRFDVILTDVCMDQMDGLALCRAVARRHPDLPVMVFTAFGDANSEGDAILAGAYSFLAKPFNLHLLCLALAAAVRQRRTPRAS